MGNGENRAPERGRNIPRASSSGCLKFHTPIDIPFFPQGVALVNSDLHPHTRHLMNSRGTVEAQVLPSYFLCALRQPVETQENCSREYRDLQGASGGTRFESSVSAIDSDY